jgi:hypothetical protein
MSAGICALTAANCSGYLKAKRSVAAHRDSGDAARGAGALGAILLLHLRHEFLDEEVVVTHQAVLRVEIEGAAGAGRQHDEVADLALAPQVGNHVPSAEVQQRLLVVAKAVQVIEHGIASRLVLIEAGGKKSAIAHRAFQNRRVDDRALGAALGMEKRSEAEGQEYNPRRAGKE